jgi:hypothetical protein
VIGRTRGELTVHHAMSRSLNNLVVSVGSSSRLSLRAAGGTSSSVSGVIVIVVENGSAESCEVVNSYWLPTVIIWISSHNPSILSACAQTACH